MDKPLAFERAASFDAEALLRVQIAAFNNDAVIYPGVALGGPPGYDRIETVLADIAEEEYYKISYEGRIVGGIGLFEREPGHFHLDVLYVDPSYHNRGIGSQAMAFIEHTYPAQVWTLDTPTYAVRNQHFYEKFGYVKVGARLEADGITLIEYEKHVRSDPP
ncbi:MAG TPA: GNAT family N-acetyltransferase [Phototrophicaceae bacterium]|nr:GNAT family N-acetyltransferase [Phototrophicaceae bacterium]